PVEMIGPPEIDHRHAHIAIPVDVKDLVCNTPILNSPVAGACAAASIPVEIHVRVSSGSITAPSHPASNAGPAAGWYVLMVFSHLLRIDDALLIWFPSSECGRTASSL